MWPSVTVPVDSLVTIVTSTRATHHHAVLTARALLMSETLLDVNVKLDGMVTNVITTIVMMSHVKMAGPALPNALELDANVKIITLATFVKKWTHFHMHTKPRTVLPVPSN